MHREHELLTVPEVAETLRVKPETVRRWLRAGKIKGVSLGSDRAGWRIPYSEIARLVVGPVRADPPQRAEDVEWHRPPGEIGEADPKVAA